MSRGSKPGERRGGRQAGVPNKFTADVRSMILGALNEAGGMDYLVQQATANPAAFMTLLGKVLPTRIEGDVEVRNYVLRAALPVESADEWLKLHAPSDSRALLTTDG